MKTYFRQHGFPPPRSFAVCLWLLLVVVSGGRALAQNGSFPAGHDPQTPARLRYYDAALAPPLSGLVETDVCIYGATSGGVIAAVQLRRLGKQVLILEPGDHLGGLSSGGLSFTDIGNKAAIGGMAHEFYRRVGQHYGADEEWRFEPHVAEEVFNEMAAEAQVPVYFRQFLQRVSKAGSRLREIETGTGLRVRARVFIDASYEGDLMAQAGVSYRVGRESNYEYGERLDGQQWRDKHQFESPVDPYLVEGDPSSGLLPGVSPDQPEAEGAGDDRVQAYNFRLCLTKQADNQIPFTKPDNYDPGQYVLLARVLATGWDQIFLGLTPLRNNKFDLNNSGAVSTDFIGMNYDYPGGDYLTRERIFQQHVDYQRGLLWFLANDPTSPESIRARVRPWGLCKDEFVDTAGWPHQLYIRECRRMLSDYVMTENNIRRTRTASDPIGLAAYTMDSHNCHRWTYHGRVWNEGDVQVGGFPPYPISYRALVPFRRECDNLLVPVCLASTHIAYGSIRMEPVFMILGQSVALAASLAVDEDLAVQDVPYPALRTLLEDGQQVLSWKP